jgi:hypothetical protein
MIPSASDDIIVRAPSMGPIDINNVSSVKKLEYLLDKPSKS